MNSELGAPEESQETGYLYITPVDINVYKTYEFYIRYTSQDNTKFYSEMKTLDIINDTPPSCELIADS